MSNLENAAKTRKPSTRPGNVLLNAMENMREKEGAEVKQQDYKSRPSPPFCSKFICPLHIARRI